MSAGVPACNQPINKNSFEAVAPGLPRSSINLLCPGLAPGRPPQQQRQLAIGLRVVREIVIDDQNVAALLHEVLCDACGGIRSDIGEARRVIAFGDGLGERSRAFRANGGARATIMPGRTMRSLPGRPAR